MPDNDHDNYFVAMATALSDVRQLVRLNALMLQAELRSNLSEVLGFVIAAAICLLFLAIGIATAVVAGFFLVRELGASPLIAALALAGLSLGIALVLALWLFFKIGRWSLVPRRTIAQFQSNLSTLRAGFANGHKSS